MAKDFTQTKIFKCATKIPIFINIFLLMILNSSFYYFFVFNHGRLYSVIQAVVIGCVNSVGFTMMLAALACTCAVNPGAVPKKLKFQRPEIYAAVKAKSGV